MLSRTADHLFWLARYLERAENMARMLDMNQQMSMMPQSLQMAQRTWRGSLETFYLTEHFDQHYELLSQQDVLHFMCFDEKNSASIAYSLKSARDNAKAVRGNLSTELWQAINTTWLEYQDWQKQTLDSNDYLAFYEWIKMRSQLHQGILMHTIYQDQAFQFLKLGMFLERADNIARLIDVKFYTLGSWQDDQKDVSQYDYADFYHWAIMLKSVSGFEAFRRRQAGAIDAEKVLNLLVFDVEFPRSLAYSMEKVHEQIQKLKNHDSRNLELKVGRLATGLEYGLSTPEFIAHLHTYLADFLASLQHISQGIAHTFMLNVQSSLDHA
jgi:uncharacterized alpha-E superfamily protein